VDSPGFRKGSDRAVARSTGKWTRDLPEIERGFWGDMRFSAHVDDAPGGPKGWTKIGSAEWLDELFPGLHAEWEAHDQKEAAE